MRKSIGACLCCLTAICRCAKADTPFDVYVTYRHQGEVVKFDGNSGHAESDFASTTWPTGIVVGPSGDFYVGSYSYSPGQSKIVEFNSSGQAVNSFAAPAINGNEFTPLGLAVGPDKMLYFSSYSQNQIYRYTFDGIASPNAAFPLSNVIDAWRIEFGPNGDFFAINGSQLYRYNPSTGNGSAFAPANSPSPEETSFTFGPNGNLFVASGDTILQYDGSTGSLIGAFVSPGSGGLSLNNPITNLAFGPNGNLYVLRDTQPGENTPSLLEFSGIDGSFVLASDILTDRSGAADLAFVAVPEPASLGVLGLAGMALLRRRAYRAATLASAASLPRHSPAAA